MLLTFPQNIVLLWEGSITGLDEALQLVLIIDYILDWARDTYRPGILRQLKCIAARGVHSNFTVTQDSDIFSMVNPIGEWLGAQSGHASVPTIIVADPGETQWHLKKYSGELHVAETLKSLPARIKRLAPELQDFRSKLPILTDTHGSVRYGTTLESRVRGILITADNLSTILQSFTSSRSKDSFISNIGKITQTQTRCFKLDDVRAISSIEQIWTNNSTYPMTLSYPTLLSMQARFWVTKNWELVRELNYIAITEEALNDLILPWKRNRLGLSKDCKLRRVSMQKLVESMEVEDKIFRKDFFLRCLQRQVLVLHHAPRIAFQHDARLKGTRGPVSELVSYIYNIHRIGYRKPAEAFIRESETIENIPPTPECPPWDTYDNGVLVRGDLDKLCLYVTDKAVAFERLVENLVSRFALDGEVFNACHASDSGALLYTSSGRGRVWNKTCRLETVPGALETLAKWIVEKKPKESQLMEMRSIFPDINMFDRLVELRSTYRKSGRCSWFKIAEHT